MCATPCTLNLLQVKCVGEKKMSFTKVVAIQKTNLKLRNKVHGVKQKQKISRTNFDYRRLGLEKVKVMIPENQL
jgi:hypothetical protein